MTDEKKKEFSRKISQASKTQLIVIMYEIVLAYTKEAEEEVQKSGNWENKNREVYLFALKKARDFVNELASALDMRFPVSYQLINLYNYIRRCLIQAETRRDKEECLKKLSEVEKTIEKLHGAFSEVAKKDQSGSVIQNSQKVYAGLTYGPGSKLNEIVW